MRQHEIKEHNAVYGEFNKTIFSIHVMMKSLEMEMLGQKGVIVKCPVCTDKGGIIVRPEMKTQTRKCFRCKSIVKFRQDNFGMHWKTQSALGIIAMEDYVF